MAQKQKARERTEGKKIKVHHRRDKEIKFYKNV